MIHTSQKVKWNIEQYLRQGITKPTGSVILVIPIEHAFKIVNLSDLCIHEIIVYSAKSVAATCSEFQFKNGLPLR